MYCSYERKLTVDLTLFLLFFFFFLNTLPLMSVGLIVGWIGIKLISSSCWDSSYIPQEGDWKEKCVHR